MYFSEILNLCTIYKYNSLVLPVINIKSVLDSTKIIVNNFKICNVKITQLLGIFLNKQ